MTCSSSSGKASLSRALIAAALIAAALIAAALIAAALIAAALIALSSMNRPVQNPTVEGSLEIALEAGVITTTRPYP